MNSFQEFEIRLFFPSVLPVAFEFIYFLKGRVPTADNTVYRDRVCHTDDFTHFVLCRLYIVLWVHVQKSKVSTGNWYCKVESKNASLVHSSFRRKEIVFCMLESVEVRVSVRGTNLLAPC